ncbi:MAG: hypothetical protein KDB53_05480, partial [Planctomycetes bacterium]|nr:hypothetical protein [Planctomycetota bacterium]
MSRPKRQRPQRPLCDHVHPDDGLDPRSFLINPKTEKKHSAERLCRAAMKVVSFALSFELEDPVLDGLMVVDARTARDGAAVELDVLVGEGR